MIKNKRNFIISLIGIIMGTIFVAYGFVNIFESINAKKKDEEEPVKSTVIKDDVEEWLNANPSISNYFIDFETDFDISTADATIYSNFFGWNFLSLTEDGSAITLENNKYTYEYTIPKAKIDEFLRKIFGNLKEDMLDVSKITLSKDYFNFMDDGENVKVQVLATDFMPNQNWNRDNINIESDDKIIVTYGGYDYGCYPFTSSCYTGYRKLELKKVDDGFNLLKVYPEKISK